MGRNSETEFSQRKTYYPLAYVEGLIYALKEVRTTLRKLDPQADEAKRLIAMINFALGLRK